MKIAQHYKVLGTGYDTNSDIKAAQFINDNDRTTMGFISKVNACSYDVVTFVPEVIESDNTVIIQETLERAQVCSLLREALQVNTDMVSDWVDRFGDATV